MESGCNKLERSEKHKHEQVEQEHQSSQVNECQGEKESMNITGSLVTCVGRSSGTDTDEDLVINQL